MFKHSVVLYKRRVLDVRHLPASPALIFISSHRLAKSLIKYYLFKVKQELVSKETFTTNLTFC